jgi:predicted O-linked N-acetylglucosamine transferase (SPINDLY family)
VALDRKTTAQQLLKAAQLTRDQGLAHLKLYLMIGLPGETMEDLDELTAHWRLTRLETMTASGTWQWSVRDGSVLWSDSLLDLFGIPRGTRLDYAEALYNRGNALSILKHYDVAIRDCERLLAIEPDYPYARGVLVHSKLQCCDWRFLDEEKAKIGAALKAGKRVVSPFNLKALSDSPSEHLRCAQLWVAHEVPPSTKPLWRGERYRHDRIRLAYVSADFNNSAVATLMAGVFEHYDRKRFETIAAAFGPADRTPMRLRLEAAFERFLDLRTQSDLDIAACLREMEIDIAVDLMGFTGECRSAIFAHRPAPLQVNYLGFPGTMGAPYIDYIVADPTVIPEDHQRFYAEKIAYLPDCYLPSDATRAIAKPPPRRSRLLHGPSCRAIRCSE